MLQVVSFQIADSIDIKLFKAAFTAEIYYSDSDELFYKLDDKKLIYVFKYGVVAFTNHNEVEMSSFLQLIKPYCKNLLEQKLSEEIDIEVNAPRNKIGYNKIELIDPDIDIIRLIMLNVSQSVALDHYYQQTQALLEETNYHTQMLERHGRLAIKGLSLKRYIGKTLYLKNRITENLYIFDSPDETWEDEVLNKMDQGLKKTFDLQARFKTIQEGLSIVKENLELFKDLLQYRNSIMLETIVIVLILVEVINLIIEKFF